jgi:hypothetical protein
LKRGRAFGLDLVGCFTAPGLWARANGGGDRPTALELVPTLLPGRDWPATGAERIHSHRFGPTGPMLTIDRSPSGYLLKVEGWGAYRVSRRGGHILLAPPAAARWRWLRLVTAQVLPLAALVQGLELLHASAVSIGGRAFAISGTSHSGKTTLAAHLALGGAGIVTDDVLAVERGSASPIAHPGAPLLNLGADIAGGLSLRERRALGSVLGRDQAGLRLLVEREQRALPLGALYFLANGSGRWPRIDRIERPEPERLLGACFSRGLRTPRRLERQLDTCARLARVPVFRIRGSRAVHPRALAAAVHEHAEAVLAYGASA